jgi:predicted outer membrane protein
MEAAANAAFSTSSSGQFKLDKDALNKLVKASPNEIKADMQTIVDVLVGYVDALNKLGVNLNDPASIAKLDASKLQELEKLTTKFDDKKFTDASDRVQAYFEKHCS